MFISLSFDYDSPAGYRESFHAQDTPPDADLMGTNALLRVLAQNDVPATFAIVGVAALPGNPPAQCQDQIRRIHSEGHEIASHSMRHRFIPPMSDEELVEDLTESRQTLEACIGAPVRGFIPPFNRPMHFPQRGAPSFSEMFGAHGRGRGRQSIATLLTSCAKAGFFWSRVSYQNKLLRLSRQIGLLRERPAQPFVWNGCVALPLHVTGFGQEALELAGAWRDSDLSITLYGHPNQALIDGNQSARALSEFLAAMSSERRRGKAVFCTMGELARRAGPGAVMKGSAVA